MIRILNARAQINHLNRAIKEAFRKTATMQEEILNSHGIRSIRNQ
jgi:hypothetical protein